MTQFRIWATAAFAITVFLALGVTLRHSLGDAFEMLQAGGPSLLVLVPWTFVAVLFGALSWRLLFRNTTVPGVHRLVVGTWIGLAVNWLLPVAQLGGEVAKARTLIQRGLPVASTSASVIADKTMQAISQILFTVLGFVLLFALNEESGLRGFGISAVVMLAFGIGFFYRIQRKGLYQFFSPVIRKFVPAVRDSGFDLAASGFDSQLAAIYDRKGHVAMAVIYRMLYRFALAGEVYLALWLMGQPVTLVEAIIIESLAQTARNTAFVVPAGVGIQEAALLITCAALGMGPEVAIALAGAKRFREVVVGGAGLVAYQYYESRSLVAAVRARPEQPETP